MARLRMINLAPAKGECPVCGKEVDMTLLERHASVCEGADYIITGNL